MAWTYEELIAELHASYTLADGSFTDASQYTLDALMAHAMNDIPWAVELLIAAQFAVLDGIWKMIRRSNWGYDTATCLLPTALDPAMAFPAAGEFQLNWKHIIRAWYSDNFEGCMWTSLAIQYMLDLACNKPYGSLWDTNPFMD